MKNLIGKDKKQVIIEFSDNWYSDVNITIDGTKQQTRFF